MKNKISIALFEPDIPQNTGTIIRLADCLGFIVHIIEPCGFIWGGKDMKRASMDYFNPENYILHQNMEKFLIYAKENKKNLVLATTKTNNNYLDYSYKNDDIILFGKESAGVPEYIHNICLDKITIKMQETKRSINLAISSAIIISEAFRQLYYNE
jgi:tRNA (cytidine/uridine-2'-O-)-methyltransferase